MLIVKRSIRSSRDALKMTAVTKDVKTIPTPTVPSQAEAPEVAANETPSGIRLISRQKHQDLKRKVLAVHDGLLRRLAEPDRQH